MTASNLTRRCLVGALAIFAAPSVLRGASGTVEVWKTPTCGCCSAWVHHLTQAGFQVTSTNLDQAALDRVKGRLGVPAQLRSCHTASVGGYTIEGHVPSADIELLLDFKPDVRGIAVPGMPIGSPGMEMGDEIEPYATYAFDETGPLAIFARHGGA